jgi:Calx-beta domain
MATVPTLQFRNSTYQMNEHEVNASIAVTRTGDNTGNATVQYAVKNGIAKDGSERILGTGMLGFTAGETQKTFQVSIPSDLAANSMPLQLELRNPTGAQLGDPHQAELTIRPAPRPLGPVWGNIWRVVRHVVLAGVLIGAIYGLSCAILATAKGWSENWREYLVPRKEQLLSFPEGTQLTAAEQVRLKDQLERTRQRSLLHLDVMTFYYTRYYMAIIMLLLVASLAAITLVLIGKKGWESTNQYIITTFFIMMAASVFFGAWPKVFRQEQNITDNKVFFLKYMALENEIFSYVVTNEVLNYMITTDELKKPPPEETKVPPPKPGDTPKQVSRAGTLMSAKDFIHYVDLQLAQDNIAIGFDYTQVPSYKNAFDTK